MTSTDTVKVTVRDTIAPTIASATADPDILWPPNHKMTMVTLTLSASDICDPGFRCRIDGVTSNEAITADWELVSDLEIKLRAERSGDVDSRIYTITVRCTDASNNSSTRTVTVTVPHDHLP